MSKKNIFEDFYQDGKEIYRQSALRIAELVDFSACQNYLEKILLERVVHSSADPELARAIYFSSPTAAEKIAEALRNGATILCDSQMTLSGLIDSKNHKFCCVDDEAVHALSQQHNLTRSHAQIFLWREKIADSVVVIGNAPTTLYGLLLEWQGLSQNYGIKLFADNSEIQNHSYYLPKPLGLIAMPVGFVGAIEAKSALVAWTKKDPKVEQTNPATELPYITLLGRRGGSALAAAATNALLTQKSIG